MIADKHKISNGDLNVIALNYVEKMETLSFSMGFRLAESGLLLVIERYITELAEANRLLGIRPKTDNDLKDRVRVLESILRGKDKMLADSKIMVQMSYEVVCEKNSLLKECKELLKGSELSELDNVNELIARL